MTTGRIIERAKGYGYVISAGRDPVSGKYKQIWRTGFKGKREAQDALREHLNQLDAGGTPADITVEEWLDRWLKEDCADMKPSTLKSYDHCVRYRIKPNIGKIKLAKLTHKDINGMYQKCLQELSPVTVHRIHRTLRAAINRAIKRGYLKESPMTRVDVPERRSPKRGTLRVNQALQMLAWLKEQRFVAYYGAYLAVYGGLRLGEVCGLQWRDVEWDTNTVYVRRARQRYEGQDVLIEPKTSDSIRDIVLPDSVIQEMRQWYSTQQSTLRSMGGNWDNQRYIVVLDDLTAPDTHAFAKGVKAALTALDFPVVTFHDLRHTHATWLLESGVDLKTVSQRLGHSSITVTADVYSHVTRRMQQTAVDKLTAMMDAENK